MWSLNYLFLLAGAITTVKGRDGFYQAPIGSPCPDADKITDEAACRSAADVLVRTFSKTIDTTCNVGRDSGQQRPNGCFHGQESVKITSTGGMCKLGGGSTFIKVGRLGSAYGDANAVFQGHFWISIKDANNPKVKSFFAADLSPKGHTYDASYVPIGRSIWLMKDNAEHDLFGPFTINFVNKNDGCKNDKGCTDGTTAMYSLHFASTTATTSNRQTVQFSVGDALYISSSDVSPANQIVADNCEISKSCYFQETTGHGSCGCKSNAQKLQPPLMPFSN
eukprot:gene6180-11591_t